jgi:hypothetical protein
MTPGAHDRGDPTTLSILLEQSKDTSAAVSKLGERTAAMNEAIGGLKEEVVRSRVDIAEATKLHRECPARLGIPSIKEHILSVAQRQEGLEARQDNSDVHTAKLESRVSKMAAAVNASETSAGRHTPKLDESQPDVAFSFTAKKNWGKILPWLLVAAVLGIEGTRQLMALLGGP